MNEYDVIVVGGGPGGYASSVRAGELGLKTALIEKECIGGMCINWGCIPTKTMLRYADLIHQKAQQKTHDYVYDNIDTSYQNALRRTFAIAERQRLRVENLLAQSKVVTLKGEARLVGDHEVEILPSGERLFAKNFIIATGSGPRKLHGVVYNEDSIVTPRGAWAFTRAPSSVVIVGSGATGLEFATIWSRFGAKVTVLEMLPAILPNEDADISIEAKAYLRHAGMKIMNDVKVERISDTGKGVEVTYSSGTTRESLVVEKALLSVGIVPNSSGLGLEALGVAMTRGQVDIDEHMRTNVAGIYAIGDITGKATLAIVAGMQGIVAAESIAGIGTRELVYGHIPHCVHSAVEVAAVGMTEQKARDRGHAVEVTQRPIASNGESSTLGGNGGFIKLVVDAKSEKLLGAHLIGRNAINLIGGPLAVLSSGSAMPRTKEILFSI
jgi:dihydrolipoamide dehydrogenase